jgi:hypothetical protein
MMKFIGDSLDYVGVRKRSGVIKRLCSKGTQLSDDNIEPYLDGTGHSVKSSRKHRKKEEVLRRKEQGRAYFREHCEDLVNAFYNKKYKDEIKDRLEPLSSSALSFYRSIPDYFSSASSSDRIDDESKRIFNFIIYLSTYMMSWSQYLVLSPDGRNMIESLFYKKTRFMALVNLFCLLNTVFICSQYDAVFFQKEFFSFLPVIEHLFPETPLQNYVAKLAAATVTKITITTFLSAFKKFILENKNEE